MTVHLIENYENYGDRSYGVTVTVSYGVTVTVHLIVRTAVEAVIGSAM